MGKAAIVFGLVIVAIIRIKGEATSNYHSKKGKGVPTFGDLLKPPPPPPPLSNISPVPFHGGTVRIQRQNTDIGYQYPPPPPPPPLPPSANFKFPAPFYRQYNFNFVPPPQPFTTTPSPNVFQKVSNWLFPSAQTSQVAGVPGLINVSPIKKDCNPCNLVPWIPVIRYDLSGKKIQQNLIPTYGPPSPTAISNGPYQYPPQAFQPLNINNRFPIEGVPHANYGPPPGYSVTPSSTYGPPSQTHTIAITSNGPPSSTHGIPSSTYGIPSSSYGIPSSSYRIPSSTYGPPSSTYGTPAPSLDTIGSENSNFRPVTPNYVTSVPSNYITPQNNDVDIIKNNNLKNELELPKVFHPSGFKNSYGEPITNNNYALDIPYPVSATAAESSKIKTEILPFNTQTQPDVNDTFTVAKPAPFTINKGRNIHTLQPVALPNLSVSPLPPIFNARPFRTNTKIYLNNIHSINNIQKDFHNVNVQSVPLAEFAHSVDYPATIIQAPLIDVNSFRNVNQSKAYRDIGNSYGDDTYSHDVSSQASEDHIAATKTSQDNQDHSFESTGLDYANDLIDNTVPLDLRQNHALDKVPSNHRPHFTDLRGISDEEVDKYRTDDNLQSIDSPLLYLKPSAPHKDFDNFVLSVSTTISNNNDYEMYDDIATTTSPELSTTSSLWHKGKFSDLGQDLSPPPIAQSDANKPKVVQIIIPYTTSNNNIHNIDNNESVSQDWISASEDESQGRKVHSQTSGYSNLNPVTEGQYGIQSTYPNIPAQTQVVTEQTNEINYNTHAILNDLYDVKEPPFDIIKLQQNIDDWTEQEYSKHYRNSHKVRPSGKYAHAKQIPDDYFTTPIPTNYVTTPDNYNYNYNFYDYEGSSSIQHDVREDVINSSTMKPRNQYNNIDINKDKSVNVKKFNIDDLLKPHIYTAASSFRSTTTTPAPWGKIQTSISPLTKEKVYVVTSKPWRDNPNVTRWYEGVPFESKRTTALDNDVSASDNLPFKSPRFLNRPPIASSVTGTMESLKADSSFSFSKSWHQSINELETGAERNTTLPAGGSEGVQQNPQTKSDEDLIETTTAENYEITTSFL